MINRCRIYSIRMGYCLNYKIQVLFLV